MATVASLEKDLNALRKLVEKLNVDDGSSKGGSGDDVHDLMEDTPEKDGTERPTLREILLWGLPEKELKDLAKAKSVAARDRVKIISELLKL